MEILLGEKSSTIGVSELVEWLLASCHPLLVRHLRSAATHSQAHAHMHHGNDQNGINLDRVEQRRVREHFGQTTEYVCLEDAPTLRRLNNLPNDSLDAPNEP